MSEPFIGQIIMFGGNFAPRGWALCDGQLISISQNTALFSILGTIYGGDGRSTFALPDLRGRVAIHAGNGPGLSNYSLGSRGGQETVTLTQNQIPSHSHSVIATNADGDKGGPDGKLLAAGRGDETIYAEMPPAPNRRVMAPEMIENTGGNQAHTNIQPYQSINYIIALTGVFPSRN